MKKLFLFMCIAVFIHGQLTAQNTSYDSNAVAIGGVDNVGIGPGALRVNAGQQNVAVGKGALENIGAASSNTAIGFEAMRLSLGGFFNTAVGKGALLNNQYDYNTGLGWGALTSNTWGEFNTATGGLALGLNTTGIENTANGFLSLYSNTTGNGNTAVGLHSLYTNTTGSYNTATGNKALFNNTGSYNTAHGYKALLSNTTGEGNTATGHSSLLLNATGTWNTATGLGALYNNTSGNSNTAFGLQSLVNNSTGDNNTATGRDAMINNITGSNNSAFGYGADVSSGALTNATAIGYQAKVTESNAIQLGNAYVAKVFNGVGNNAIFITGGLQVTGGTPGIGKVLTSDAAGVATWQTPAAAPAAWSLTGNAGTVDGTNFIGTTDNVPFNIRAGNQTAGRIEISASTANTFYGFQAGLANTGRRNSAYGYRALTSNTSGLRNTANGAFVLVSNTDGSSNTGSGGFALSLNSSGSGNTANGDASLLNNSIGNNNTAVGNMCLQLNTTGNGNTAVGLWALGTNVTGSNNTALGNTADVNVANLTNATAIGNGALVNNSNKVRIGNGLVTVVEIEATAIYTGSDGRFKTNISESDVKGLDFIKRLRPVTYNMDTKEFEKFLTKDMPDSTRDIYMDKDFGPSTAIRQSGFIAQEVEKAANESGYNFNAIHKPENENDNYSLAYSQFVVPLVKAVQEQQAMIESLQKEINELKRVPAADLKVNSQTVELGDNNNIVLNQNVPNPFAQQTCISYTIPASANSARILFYAMDGRLMKTANITTRGKGILNVYANDLGSGSYMYSLVVDGKTVDTKKLVKQ